MEKDLKFQKPEPIKFRQDILRKYKMEWETDAHIDWRVEKEHYDRFNSITEEQRQQCLDLWRTGITIGEVGEKLKIDYRVVGDVIYLNIAQSHYLRNETL